jgi:hypothetical protein
VPGATQRLAECFAAATTSDTELVDPLMLMIAEGGDGSYGQEESKNPHRLLFVVLAQTLLKSSLGSDGTTTPVWRLIATQICIRWGGSDRA